MKGDRNGFCPAFLKQERNTRELRIVHRHIRISTKPVYLFRINGGEVRTTEPDKWIKFGAQMIGETTDKGIDEQEIP